ncbi:hypothetical protein [Azotobacter chroococcum]|uniref:Uncharacterized protein n=1 Tax=Azotobacter chroococcum TaxID=353 RepID=A0AAP9YH91_9GAMM|nr:hypothetical protein [Azotobacter chroococcum]QQE90460.1 hypothetical protein GKQ51_09385 [Azotobacter chroococcum]
MADIENLNTLLQNLDAEADIREKAGWPDDGVAEQANAVRGLIAENERLREVLAEKLIDSTMLTGIDIGNGSLTIGAKGGVCGIMADSFGQMLFESGAENYIEAFFSSSKHPELGQIVVTVKRETGKTPHQLRQVAEAERDQLKAESERLKQELSGPHDVFAKDLVKELVDNAQAILENSDDGEDEFYIVLMASAERLRRQEAKLDQLKAELERLQEQQKPAGGAGAAENCRCNEKLQVVQELQAEREALASLLRRFVENEHNAAEDVNERHWYFTEAETLLAKIGGKYPDYALVPEEKLYALKDELERVRADAELLRKHLAECADSLESEILDRFGSSKDHPAMRRKFECDMQDVIEARAALGKGGGQNGSKTAETRASAGLEGGGHGSKGTGGHSAENQAETRVNPGSELAGKGGRTDV